MSKYLLKLCVIGWVLWIVIKILVAVSPQPTSYYSSYSSGSDYRSSGYSSSSYNRTPTPTPRPVVTSSSGSSARTTSSSRTYTSSYTDRDVDDYDVDGFYYDNRGDFENEDDAWDYLEDEPDDWD